MTTRETEGKCGPSWSTIGAEHNSTNFLQAGLARPPETNPKGSNVARRVTATPRNTAAEPQSFEWIPVQGDPTARRRARAHISRGFRRKKAQEEAQAKHVNKDNASTASSSSRRSRSEKDQSSATSAGDSPPNYEADVRSAQTVIENLILKRTLGTGGGSRGDDPFQCFPVKLSRRDQAILDHCELSPSNKMRKSSIDAAKISSFMRLEASRLSLELVFKASRTLLLILLFSTLQHFMSFSL